MSAELHALGKLLLIVGLLMAATGAVLLCSPHIPWLGHLPGDLVIRRGGMTFYVPLASCLLLSALVSLLVWLIGRFRP